MSESVLKCRCSACQLATAKPWSTSWSTVQALSDRWKLPWSSEASKIYEGLDRFMFIIMFTIYIKFVKVLSINRHDSATLETLERSEKKHEKTIQSCSLARQRWRPSDMVGQFSPGFWAGHLSLAIPKGRCFVRDNEQEDGCSQLRIRIDEVHFPQRTQIRAVICHRICGVFAYRPLQEESVLHLFSQMLKGMEYAGGSRGMTMPPDRCCRDWEENMTARYSQLKQIAITRCRHQALGHPGR